VLRLRSTAPRQHVAAGRGGGKAALVSRLRRVALLRRLRAMRGPAGEWHGWSGSMYLPMLAHVAEQLRAGARESGEMPLSASIAALDLLDRARRAGEGGR
jgi:hypothetical protein